MARNRNPLRAVRWSSRVRKTRSSPPRLAKLPPGYNTSLRRARSLLAIPHTLPEMPELPPLYDTPIRRDRGLLAIPDTLPELPELPRLQSTPIRRAGSLLAIPDTLPELPELPRLQSTPIRQAGSLLAIPDTLPELPELPRLQSTPIRRAGSLLAIPDALPEMPELPRLQSTPMRWAGGLLAIPDTLPELPELPRLQSTPMRRARGLLAIPDTLPEVPEAPGPSDRSSSGSQGSSLPSTLPHQDRPPGVPAPTHKAVEHGLGLPAGLTIPAPPRLLGKEPGNLCQRAQPWLKCTRCTECRKPCREVPDESVELLRKIVQQNEVIISHLRLMNGLPLAPSAALTNLYNLRAEDITSESLGDNHDGDDDDDEEE
ncbi:MAG: hypothetical protein M1839_005948 [Geoglossum umbratile]|nr:MAG: hypothetical protein M1839_005948 [Geoglossum umbratile]